MMRRAFLRERCSNLEVRLVPRGIKVRSRCSPLPEPRVPAAWLQGRSSPVMLVGFYKGRAHVLARVFMSLSLTCDVLRQIVKFPVIVTVLFSPEIWRANTSSSHHPCQHFLLDPRGGSGPLLTEVLGFGPKVPGKGLSLWSSQD